MPRTRICMSCRSYDTTPHPDETTPLPANHGYCRRNPPDIQYIGANPSQLGQHHWPVVHETDWCEDWQEHDEEPTS